MPATPATWLNDFVVNLTTAGAQANPRVTQLANGNTLVVWDSTDNTGVGSPAGIDVIGQVFDPLGNPVGAEVRLNIDSTVNDEQNADVAALPDGGFVVVYQRTNGNSFDLLVEQFDATGAHVRGGTFAFDSTSGAAPSNFPPVVAVSNATSALLVWEQSEVGGQSQILGRVYNPSTGTFGPEFTVLAYNGTNRTPAVTVLNNGTYVIAAATDVGGDQFITYRIVNPAGGNVLPATQLSSTVGDAELDGDPSVTALTDGGFVITWTNTDAADTDIMAQRFDLNGNVVDGAFEVTSVSGVDSAADPVTVALLDGGYLVIWNDTGSTPGLRVRHFSASGILQGAEYTIFGDFVADPDAVRLADGRVAVTFRDAAGENRMEIIDTRDTANATGVYTPQSWQIGTIGDDTITGDGVASFVHGHDGNDTINSGANGLTATYSGGAGNDVINVVASVDPDAFQGNAGNDLIDWTASGFVGGTFNLTTGQFTDGFETRVMTGFEHLTGTGGDDSITGTTGANSLSGGVGDDSITAGLGDDTLFGGGNADVLSGGTGNDSLDGGLGEDSLFGGDNDDVLAGGGDADVLFGGEGNDRFEATGDGQLNANNGDGGNDTFALSNAHYFGNIFGGVGTADHVDGSGSVDFALVIDLAAQFYNDGGQFTLTGIENATGGGQADRITGDANANTLAGGLGDDTLFAGTGSDRLSGDAGNDTLTGDGAGADTFFGGADTDTLDLSGSAAAFTFNTQTGLDAVLTGLLFQQFEVFLFGAQADVISTHGTITVVETVFGGAGNDTVIDTGSTTSGAQDSYEGGIGIDTLVYTNLGSTVRTVDMVQGILFSNTDVRDTFTGFENVTITLGANNIIGDGADNILTAQGTFANSISGGGGNDTIDGGEGADSLFGGTGNDVLRFGTGAASVQGDAGNDTYAFTTALTDLSDTSGTADVADFTGWTGADGVNIQLDIGLLGTTASIGSNGVAGIEHVQGSSLADAIIGDFLANSLDGNNGGDLIEGQGGNDTLSGGGGADTLFGGNNDDTLRGGAAADTMFGDDGNDVFRSDGGGFSDESFGGSGNDLFVLDNVNDMGDFDGGADLGDLIDGSAVTTALLINLAGTYTFSGDTFSLLNTEHATGGSAGDTITGSTGANRLFGGAGRDSLSGGAGNDDFGTITAATGFDDIDGGADIDRVSFAGTTQAMTFISGSYSVGAQSFSLSGIEDLTFGSGHDSFTTANTTPTRIDAGNGDDLVNGNLTGTFIGGSGRDRLSFEPFTTNLTINLATDTLRTGWEDLTLGSGNDLAFGTDDANSLVGGDGNDQMSGRGGADALFGGNNNDTLFGGGGADSMDGGSGNDRLFAGDGTDNTTGGTGHDVLVLGTTAAVSLDMTTGVTNGFGTHTAFEQVQMGTGDDTVTGTVGNDTINGHVGRDTLFGGAGDDSLSGDTVGLAASSNRLEGGSGNDLLQHFAGAMSLFGGTDNDLIELYTQGGQAVTGILDGGAGTDRLNLANLVNGALQGASLTGIEILETGPTPTTATAAQFEGFDTIRLSDTDSTGAVRLILAATGADTVLDLTDELARAGGARSVTLTGSTDNETLRGGAGVDSISAGAGFDTVIGGNGADVTNGGADFDTLDMRSLTTALTFNMATGATNGFGTHTGYEAIQAGAANDTLTGDGQGNEIYGGAGRNTINGAGGDDNFEEEDTLLDRADGGTGQDYVSVKTQLATGTVINLTSGQVTLGAATLTQWTNFEDLAIYGGNSAVTVIGTDGVNNFGAYGGTGAERFEGRGGNDFLYSGAGNDALFGGDGNDYMVGYQGDDTLDGGIGDDYLDSGGGLFNDTLFGGTGNDTLFGSAGQNLIETGNGVDRASGSGGNDVIIVADLTDGLIDGGDDTDTLVVNFAGAHTFNLATGAITNGGPALALQWQGFEHYRNASGGASSETVIGSTGDNTISFDGSTGAHSAHGDAGHDVLRGGSGLDRLSGGEGNDTLFGGSGNDLLTGDGGTDTVFGGLGNDAITGDTTGGSVAGDAGADLVRLFSLTTRADGGADSDTLDATGIAGNLVLNLATSALQTGFEHLLFGVGNDRGTGTGAANILRGGAGNDRLNGGAGGDSLFGDGGADTLAGGTGADRLTGGTGNDRLVGGGGIDRLVASAGDDNLAGGGAGDILSAGGGKDRANGGGGADVIKGGGGGDTLSGGGAGDRLIGGGGSDRLIGGTGTDLLNGGAGADVFVFGRGAGADRVTRFQNGSDLVDLTGTLTFADLTETAIAGGVRLTITATPVHHIDLMGVTVAQVNAGDFI